MLSKNEIMVIIEVIERLESIGGMDSEIKQLKGLLSRGQLMQTKTLKVDCKRVVKMRENGYTIARIALALKISTRSVYKCLEEYRK